MTEFTSLWLPILVSSVVVFFASFLAWMVLGHHKADVKALPDERAFIDRVSELKIPAGTYMWPNCATGEDMKSPEFQQRFDAGPWGSINIVGAKPNFGQNLTLTFLFYVVVSVFVAYITGEARGPGSGFGPVFQVAGSVAILAYCAGSIPNAIFFSKPGRFVFTEFVDGLAYGLLTGLVFALMWPVAA